MTNCLPDLNYSITNRNNRLAQARATLGVNFVNRIIAFAFFLLGANRKEIANYLEIPLDTLLSFFTRITKYGAAGFFDRRTNPVHQPEVKNNKLTCTAKENQLELHFGNIVQTINVPDGNVLQFEGIILTFLDNGIISRDEAAKALNCSCGNTDKLLHKMRTEDISGLIDKRKGQQKDYVFTPEIKSELIIQFAANAVTGKPTTSPVLAVDLERRTSQKLSERSIRFHISGLGLKGKAGQLKKIISLKKTVHVGPDGIDSKTS